MKMPAESTLQDVGLSKNESKIYLCLLRSGRLAVSGISKATGVHRRNVYDSMSRLVEKGLAFQVFSSSENAYEAVNPDKLMEHHREKEERLLAVLPTLRKEFAKTPRCEEVYVYKGVEGFKNYLREVLRLKEDLYILGAKGFWFDPRLRPFTSGFLKEAKREKIKFYSFFDQRVQDELPEVLKLLPKPHKFLPSECSTSVITNIFADRVVNFVGAGIGDLGPEITLFVTVNQEMADGYKTWFRYLWKKY